VPLIAIILLFLGCVTGPFSWLLR